MDTSMPSIIELNARLVTTTMWWLLGMFIVGCLIAYGIRYLIKRIWPRRA